MNLFPLDLAPLAGTVRYALLFGAVGFAVGFVLEMAGFGDTRKLAAQFYLRDMTVLKVMFTGIAVTAVLVAGASSFGLLDLQRVWVNPTFLWSEILGGLIMGVGFVVGGFCPGTSLVATATLKIDGVLFLLGAFVGVFAFGETVSGYEPFWLSSDFGRLTLPELLDAPMGVVVAGVVVLAIGAFAFAEWLEARLRGEAPRFDRRRLAGAGALLALALITAVHGQPTPAQRWARIAPAKRAQVQTRAIFVDPAEVVSLRKDLSVETEILDLRDEHDFNLFHVGGARRVAAPPARDPALLRRLLARPAHVVTFLIGNGEERAREAWEELTALGVTNLYVVEGGVSRWLSRYPLPACVATASPATGAEGLGARFTFAVGDRTAASWPELPITDGRRAPCEPTADETDRMSHARGHAARWPEHPFTKRVQLQTKSVVKGGCG
jgi:hypothetical protein